MTHGQCACRHSPSGGPVVAVRGPATGRADRDRSTRAGYLAESQHHMLPASRRSPSTANTISRRGPGQRLELTTGEPAFAIGRQATVRISTPPSQAVARRAQGHHPASSTAGDRRAHPASDCASGRASCRRLAAIRSRPHPLWIGRWPLAAGRCCGGSSVSWRQFSGCGPARMLVIEACPAWTVTSACGACGCVLAWARAGTARREEAHAYPRWPDMLAVPKRVSVDGCGTAVGDVR
jgi:hypothetical protein